MPSNVRRRNVPESQSQPQSQSTSDTDKHDSAAQVREPTDQPLVQIVQKPKTRKRRNTFIFLLGGLCGLIAAGFFASSNDLIEFPELLGDLSMDTFVDILPAGLISDVRDLMQGERDIAEAYDSFYVGLKARAEGLHADHPMVMIPGVISTGLESWGTANVSRSYFRKRLWGSWTMMRALVMDKENWKRHVMLDKHTGLDPPMVKLRAAQGFDATDFFITGYWIWNKIFENLATIGYDPTNSFTAAYDWRLSYPDLEVRDRYFSRLKSHIEGALATDGRKVVLASHSMGSQVIFYFFNWVESEHGGHGGSDWVEKHVDSWINISGCMLGAVKDLTAVLSGEMRDTAQLNAFAIYGLEKFLSKAERAEIFRAMPGISSMLPIGGEAVWGGKDWAPDDLPGQAMSYGSFLNFRASSNSTSLLKNMTVDDSIDYLMNVTEDWYGDKISKSYSRGIAQTTADVEKNQNDPKMWHNPLASRLPKAPSLKIFCFYGVGKPTERGYYYRVPDQSETLLNITIDTDFTEGPVDHGVVMGEGDGTVNLLSTGYMCNRGWHMKRYNPAGSRITVVEMPHEPERFNPRGGPKTADHVDILGRQNLNELILRIAAGKGDTISDYIVSDIVQYADKIKIYEEGEELKGGTARSICNTDGVATGVHLDMMALADVEGATLSAEEEKRLWTDIDTCVSSPCDDHESIDDALRTWLELTARLRDRLPGSQEDSILCAQMLINSQLFQQNQDYVRTQLIHSLLQEDDVASLHAITSLLLLDGHYDETIFPRMIEETCFPRLVELIAARQDDEDPRLHRFLLQLMYEMSRVERLRPEELVLVDDNFIHSLFRIIEGVSNDVHDPYHYPTIRVLLVMNEQYMLASTEPVEGPHGTHAPLTNRIVKCLSLHGPSFRTFGENIILLLNRETETSLQLLILKLLYLLFTTKATYEYFYTNDLRVLLDVIIRNLMDLPDERISLRHTYLRVLYPLLAHTQLSHPPHYKQDEILKVLKILRGSLNAHFAPADDTTVRLVDRVAKVKWLEAGNLDGAAEVARKFLGISLSPTQYASSISVGDVAGVMEKPGVQTPSRNGGNGPRGQDVPSPTQDEVSKTVKAKKPLPAIPKHRHGVPFNNLPIKPSANGEVKKVPPKAPPPRRRGKMKVAEPPPIETITEAAPE